MEIRPFRGWRYRAGADGSVDAFIAPPYDILSAQDKQDLLARGSRNIVAVDLPQVPPKEAGPDHLYRQAAELLNQWQASGVLMQDDRPAAYVYQQSFSWAAQAYTRTALVCGVRATELGRDVIPHEHTFAGPKADRLKLTQHTRMQLSPVFGFFRDADGGVERRLLAAAASSAPVAHGKLRGVCEKLWAVTDAGEVAALAAAVRGEPVFIADGHHRYSTALNYCRSLRAAGAIDDDHEANFVLFALVPDSDPGLVILPTHRVVRGLADGFALDKLIAARADFSWQRRSPSELDLRGEGSLAALGPGAMAFLAAGAPDVWVVRLTDPRAMAATVPGKPEAWRKLDVAVLHELILDRALRPWWRQETSIEYTPDAGRVLSACASGEAKLGVCLQSTPLSAVRDVALAGEVMPHKTTYFYPKLTTGMVLKPLQ